MNKFLKESLITTAFVLMSSGAMAAELAPTVPSSTAIGVFQWSGIVPPANINNGICIAEVEGKTPHHSGVITFHNRKDTDGSITYDIQSSSELTFRVHGFYGNGKPCGTDHLVWSYQYALTALKVSVNAEQMQSKDSSSNWQVMHAKPGTAMQPLEVNGQAVENLKAQEVTLTLAGNNLEVDSGDIVTAQAFLLVTNID